MLAKTLKKKYFDFFVSKEHKLIPSASLIPENDPTVLFTTAGMHPLVPYLMGQKHPTGSKRLVNVQKCLRTGDIDDVGDSTHNTFFQMLGNWSLGDYFKKEAIEMSFEFLTDKKWLGFNSDKLHVTVFKGDKNAPKDVESAKIWQDLGIPKDRILFLPKEDNWWGPAGLTGPCGPDTEMFIDTGKKACSPQCRPGCGCGKYFEIWNDVFMQYNKTDKGTYIPLKQKNVDTGMGVGRTIAMLQGAKTVYETELFLPIISKVEKIVDKSIDKKHIKSFRIIADHMRAATFILGDPKAIPPSNLGAGYVLRRLVRRAIRHGKILGTGDDFSSKIAEVIIKQYSPEYSELNENETFILEQLQEEENKFSKTLDRGLKEFKKISSKSETISGKDAFVLFTSYGFPLEMTQELAKEKGKKVDILGFKKSFDKHIELSRKATSKTFKGGLADSKEETTKLHTATHLLHSALRKVLGKDVWQKGSNITAERLRFDFAFDRKLEDEEIKKIEELVNSAIDKKLDVKREIMSVKRAKELGAIGFFEDKYGDEISVYTIGDFSKEICGGPHVDNIGDLGRFKIIKQESVGAGVRRIKAVLELI